MNKAYKATVITPFHNTKPELFLRTYHSLLEQTVGFGNIEWIVVLHNCTEESKTFVKELLGAHGNVVIKELNNEARSASSPRNHGLGFVTSPYIMFLDSDDTYYPQTVEVCLQKMQEHHPDIVIFRMAFLKQNDSVREILTDRSLWNPLVEEVVLNGNEKYREELYSTIQFSGSNKMFSRELIERNKIAFDEKINMAEDAYFVMLCYEKAEKIVVLPQFIGHCYFLNSTSTVQSVGKPRAEVLQFTYGYKLMFDLIMKSGEHYNHFMLIMLQFLIVAAYSSPEITPEDWKHLQEEMRPYAEKLSPPQVNKFFTEEEGKQLYEFVRKNILEPRTEQSFRRRDYFNGEEILLKIVKANTGSDFGKYYDFKDIGSINEFRERVPLYDHSSFDNLIRIQTTVGEKNVLTSNRIIAYAYDVDDSEEVKTIPVSAEGCIELGKEFIQTITDRVTFLMMESHPKGRTLNDYTYNDSVNGIMVCSSLGRYTLSDAEIPGVLTSPFSLIFPKKTIDSEYLGLLCALRNPDVTQIVANNTWVVLHYLDRFFENAEDLCKAIETGKIVAPDPDTEDCARHIAELWLPAPERAEEIRKAFGRLPKREVIKAIWPKLERIVARSGGIYALYTEQLAPYISEIPIDSGKLITPFGMIADSTTENGVYKLLSEKAFFEFLPSEGNDGAETVLLSELKPGKIYELVVTNPSGVYRMRTNSFIKPVRTEPGTVYFTECERPVTDDNGVVCTEEDIRRILHEPFGELLFDFSFHFRKEEKKLMVFVETNICEEGRAQAEEGYAKTLERYLTAIDGIERCEVIFCEKGSRLELRDLRRSLDGVPADCIVPLRNLNDIKLIADIEVWNRKK
ncbi:MAG: GH3 auxin-responsive promoter family protein [Clostridia bacterium]|nr:GH3 auxin-responsive promoter family protein [Clostridia bacterium]